MNDDMELLRNYALRQSEQAFETLVSRYVNLVYSAAVRRVHDPHLAEDVTQVVFALLARKAGTLGSGTIIPSWLHRTAGFVAADVLRSQRRRAQRELEAHMRSQLNEPETELWPQIAPFLDTAMDQLGEKDRHAIVLRFFQNKSLGEIGTMLGASEAGARMRVNRALEKLRQFFMKRGIASTTTIIAGAICANSIQAAPAGLAKTATVAALTKGATASTSTLPLIKGALKIMAWAKVKTAIVVTIAAILIAGTTTTAIVHYNHHASVQIDFPRSSWKTAGYADPVSAFETAFWATSQNDGKTILASLTPELRQKLNLSLSRGNMSPEEFLSQDKYGAGHLNGVTGFHVVKSEIVSDNEVRLHMSIQGRPGEQAFTMKKFGDEWKMDNFPSGF